MEYLSICTIRWYLKFIFQASVGIVNNGNSELLKEYDTHFVKGFHSYFEKMVHISSKICSFPSVNHMQHVAGDQQHLEHSIEISVFLLFFIFHK